MMTRSHTIRSIVLAVALLTGANSAQAQSFTIAPTPFQTAFDNSGKIINNACVWTYLAGTTTPATTYADNIGTPNSDPIRSDSAGRFTAYLLAGSSYKFVYESSCSPPSHGTVLRTADNISGVPSSSATVDVSGTAGETISAGQCAYLSDGSGGKTAGQWYKCDTANAYSSSLPQVGLAPSAIVAGGTGTIRVSGSVTGLSSLVVGSKYYVGTAGAITTTAGNGRVLGSADSASSFIVAANPSTAGWTVITSTSTGTLNNFAPGLVGNTILRMNNATLATITGIAAGYDGQRLLIVSVGAGEDDLANLNGSSTAANQLRNIATFAATPLAPGSGTAEYVYDLTATNWRLVEHEQGAWIAFTPALAFGGASVGITYATQRGVYRLSGRTVQVHIQIVLTSKGSSTGGATVTNLPFATVSPDTPVGSIIDCEVAISGLTGTPYALPSVGTSTVLLSQTSATTRANLADTNFAATSDIRFSATYQTS